MFDFWLLANYVYFSSVRRASCQFNKCMMNECAVRTSRGFWEVKLLEELNCVPLNILGMSFRWFSSFSLHSGSGRSFCTCGCPSLWPDASAVWLAHHHLEFSEGMVDSPACLWEPSTCFLSTGKVRIWPSLLSRGEVAGYCSMMTPCAPGVWTVAICPEVVLDLCPVDLSIQLYVPKASKWVSGFLVLCMN